MATIELEIRDGLDTEAVKRHFQGELDEQSALRELADVLASSKESITPSVAGSMAAVELFWREIPEKYGVYTASDIAVLRGADPKNRSVAANFAKRNGLVGYQRGQDKLYPQFQFLDSEVHPDWTRLAQPLFEAQWPQKHIIYWVCGPNGYLGGREPVELIGTDEIDKAVDAAQEDVKGFWG